METFIRGLDCSVADAIRLAIKEDKIVVPNIKQSTEYIALRNILS